MIRAFNPKPSDKSIAALFSKIENNIRVSELGCWLWKGPLSQNGYARLYCAENKKSYAIHRISVWKSGRDIPNLMVIDHVCRNPACANADHLEVVTNAENCRRGFLGAKRSREAKAMTHCHRGHEYTDDNTYRNGLGHRSCKTCAIESYHRRKTFTESQTDAD